MKVMAKLVGGPHDGRIVEVFSARRIKTFEGEYERRSSPGSEDLLPLYYFVEGTETEEER